MKLSQRYALNTTTTGIIVIIFLSLFLLAGRFACKLFLAKDSYTNNFIIAPSGLVDPEIEMDPNTAEFSYAESYPAFFKATWFSMGCFDYFLKKTPCPEASNNYLTIVNEKNPDRGWAAYYDKKLGLFVYGTMHQDRSSPINMWKKEIHYYIGPKGIDEEPSPAIGRFSDILILDDYRTRLVYDMKLQCFFSLNFHGKRRIEEENENETITRWVLQKPEIKKGPKLTDPTRQPAIKYSFNPAVHVYWRGPYGKSYEGPDGKESRDVIKTGLTAYNRQYTRAIVDTLGRIHLLDTTSLQYTKQVATLPHVPVFFGIGNTRPIDMLDYDFNAVFNNDTKQFHGLIVLAVNRETNCMAMDVYNDEGKIVATKASQSLAAQIFRHGRPLDVYNEEGKVVKARLSRPYSGIEHYSRNTLVRNLISQKGWQPCVSICNYILENLHGPILHAASFATANHLPPKSRAQSLLLMPDSFIARLARTQSQPATARNIGAFFLAFPSILIASILAIRIDRNAKRTGLPPNTRHLWALTTLALGLPAWITYKLTRPTAQMVTCSNCGKLRRPDQDICHNCKSNWPPTQTTQHNWQIIEPITVQTTQPETKTEA